MFVIRNYRHRVRSCQGFTFVLLEPHDANDERLRRDLLARTGGQYDGTVGSLLVELRQANGSHEIKLPTSPRGLSDRLRQLGPAFRVVGTEIRLLAHGRNGSRVRITRSPEPRETRQPSPPSQRHGNKPEVTQDSPANAEDSIPDWPSGNVVVGRAKAITHANASVDRMEAQRDGDATTGVRADSIRSLMRVTSSMTNASTLARMQLDHPNITRTCAESEIYETLLALDGANILELGCGKADHTRRIASTHLTATVTATEVDRVQHAINLATSVPTNMRFADFGAESIPLSTASVDVVLMFKSLHHVPAARLEDALNEIARVLKPGGHAYISEPIFAGDFNEMIRIFNDEQATRQAAFDALCHVVERGRLQLVSEVFFLLPVKYKSFAEFASRHFEVTHSERYITDAQRMAVERLFNSHLGSEGVQMSQQIRIDLLRKAH